MVSGRVAKGQGSLDLRHGDVARKGKQKRSPSHNKHRRPVQRWTQLHLSSVRSCTSARTCSVRVRHHGRSLRLQGVLPRSSKSRRKRLDCREIPFCKTSSSAFSVLIFSNYGERFVSRRARAACGSQGFCGTGFHTRALAKHHRCCAKSPRSSSYGDHALGCEPPFYGQATIREDT